ncbi:MAG: prepilin peptidase [Sulfitobacter sp.]
MTPLLPKRTILGDLDLWASWAGFSGLYFISCIATLIWGNVSVFEPAFLIAIPVLIIVSTVDYRTNRIPDFCSFSLGALGVWFTYDTMLVLHLAAAISLGLLLWAASEWYFRAHAIEALGLGDVKLIVALTIWLGPERLAIMLFLASTAGIAVVLLHHAKNALGFSETLPSSDAKLAVPFGPFLAYSFFLTIVTSST